jgi:hypothetical protein
MQDRIKFLIVFLLPATLFLSSCGTNQPNSSNNPPNTVSNASNQPTQSPTPELKTITKMDQMEDDSSAVFQAPNGKTYTVVSEKAEPETDTEMESQPKVAAGNESLKLGAKKKKNEACEREEFDGKDRRAAKISVDGAAVEDFDNLADFIKTLPSDQKIGDELKPPISSGETSRRVKEEKRNVHIKTTWLYAYKRESDEDYHIIIGTTPDKQTAVFFNVEISGLPAKTSASFKKLNAARTSFKEFFGIADKCSGDSYKKFINQPIEIEIIGSAFFDKLHFNGKGAIGPQDARAKSYWEIHPLSSIVFK